MPENEVLILIHKYLSGDMESSDRQEFEQRLTADPALASLKEEITLIWTTSGLYQEPGFDTMNGHRVFRQRVQHKISRTRLWIAGAAASLLLILAAGGYYLGNRSLTRMQDLSADAQTERKLEDGSRIEMHAGAHVRIPESFNGRTRSMEIVAGDVYFDISADASRPFVIGHPWAEVTVVGTEFVISVDTIEHTFQIIVTEGKVIFRPHLSEEKIAVAAGTGLKFDADTRVIEPMLKPDINAISWHTGELTFVDRPVSQVIADLSSHYKVEIEITNEDIKDCLFTAPLPYRNVPVTVILDALSTTFSALVKELGTGHYQLTGGKCK